MELGAKILVLGGVLSIAYGLLTGIPAGVIRQKSATYPKYLRFAHMGALMWGPILISLALAVELSPLSQTVELWGAGSLSLKDTLNWLMGVEDEFARMPRLPIALVALGGLSALTSIIGIAILTIGVVRGL